MRFLTLGLLLVLASSNLVPAGEPVPKVALKTGETKSVLTDEEWAAYEREPWRYTPRSAFTPQIWAKYVRAPYLLDPPYKNGQALMLQGQEPLELKPLPDDKKIVLCYHVPRGEKPDDWYREKIGIVCQFGVMPFRKMGAAIAGDTNLEKHGLRFEFDSSNRLVIHYVSGKLTAAEYLKHPQAGALIRNEVCFYCQNHDPWKGLRRWNYAYLIFAHTYVTSTSGGQKRWTPDISQSYRSVVFSGEMLANEAIGTTVRQEMAYLRWPDSLRTAFLPRQRIAEILPYEPDFISQELLANGVIGTLNYHLALALGCESDSYPHSIMNRDGHLTKLHFGKRHELAIKPSYFPPVAAKVLQPWVE